MKVVPTLYAGANAIGALLYVALDMRIVHVIHAEHRQGADMSDIITFAVTALPVLLVFTVANVALVIWASIRLSRYRERSPIFLSISVLAAWAALVVVVRQVA